MLAILLSLLFAATALASIIVIQRAVAKGWRAAVAIQRELAETVETPVRLRRPVVATAGRGPRRSARMPAQRLCAAA